MFYFTPLTGYFSPFPHGTGSLSVMQWYLALEDGPPRFPQGFTCPTVLRNTLSKRLAFRIRVYHPLWRHFPESSTILIFFYLLVLEQKYISASYNPLTATPVRLTQLKFRLFPVRSPLLRESQLISFPPAT